MVSGPPTNYSEIFTAAPTIIAAQPLWTERFLESIPAGCSGADPTRVEPLTVQVIPEMTNGAVSETRRILNDAFDDTRWGLE
jgi:hypothetical protein